MTRAQEDRLLAAVAAVAAEVAAVRAEVSELAEVVRALAGNYELMRRALVDQGLEIGEMKRARLESVPPLSAAGGGCV